MWDGLEVFVDGLIMNDDEVSKSFSRLVWPMQEDMFTVPMMVCWGCGSLFATSVASLAWLPFATLCGASRTSRSTSTTMMFGKPGFSMCERPADPGWYVVGLGSGRNCPGELERKKEAGCAKLHPGIRTYIYTSLHFINRAIIDLGLGLNMLRYPKEREWLCAVSPKDLQKVDHNSDRLLGIEWVEGLKNSSIEPLWRGLCRWSCDPVVDFVLKERK